MQILTTKLLKQSFVLFFCVAAALYLFNGTGAAARTAAVPASRTGAPALGSVAAEPTCTACHTTNPLNAAGGTLTITLPDTYSAGQDVPVTVSMTRAEVVKFGFQVTALNDQGQRAGDFVLTEAARTQLQNGAAGSAYDGRQYVAHTTAGTATTTPGQITWSFTWKAPAQAAGRVTFYVAGNATNNLNNNSNDFVYNTSKAISSGAVVPTVATAVSAASFAAGSSPDAWVSLFGTGLAPAVQSATQTPLPTQLGEVRVRVRDANNTERDAQLLFVSPLQINLLIPGATANGNATISVLRNDVTVATGTTSIAAVNPGIYTANATGTGVPAGYIVRQRGTAQTIEQILSINGATIQTLPIDLGPEGDQVALVLFGSGWRGRSALTNVTAMIGGAGSTVLGAGAQGDLPGVDQANILIPRSLIGRGNANVALTVDGKAANMVTINIK